MATVELKPVQAASRKIDAKRAAQVAMKYFHDMFPGQPVNSLALEEVELSEDENYWMITLSHQSKDGAAQSPNYAAILGLKSTPTSKYKVFKVDARTGKVVSMKIRKFE